MSFTNKVVVISGAGSGIGKEAAYDFLSKGAKVVVNGRRESVLADAFKDYNGNVKYAPGDIGNPETAKRIVDTAVNEFGGVDIVVNNAGIFSPKPFLDETEEGLASYIDIILKGTFYLSQAAIPEIKKRGGGAIVNVGSMWATQAIEATPSSAYSAAKGGVHTLTRNLAIEFAKDNIRVNAVAPAVVETPVYGSFIPEDQVSEVLAGFNGFHPLGRIGQPKDIVSAISYLACDESGWITGAVIPVDGGVTAGRNTA
ncbi:MAG: glucose-1-dehydrogenase [Thermodesulfobacteriota bacterium]|nr:MAG: glucose-1-dehydrogenase [Thermodesulfobacteriota bacterium]